MNDKLYPSLVGISSLHLTPEGAWLRTKMKTRLDNSIMQGVTAAEGVVEFKPSLPVNKSARDFLMLCDGIKNFNEIDTILTRQYDIPIDRVKECIEPFIQKSIDRKYIKTTEEPNSHSVPTTGSLNAYFPVHMQFELTEKCNMACSYCYRSSGFVPDPSFKKRVPPDLPYEKVQQMFDLCISKGVANIEITGGEPTLSPYFEDVMRLIAGYEVLAAVETNGTMIDENLSDILAEAGNIMLSISLDGYNEETNAAISKCPGAFDRTIKGIKLLVDRKVICRVSSIVCEENIDHIEELLLLAKDLGAVQYGLAFPMDFGRHRLSSKKEEEEKDPTKTLSCRFMRIWKEMLEKYPMFAAELDEPTLKYHKDIGNCGIGHRSFTVDPRGNIRPCVTNTANWSVIGNLCQDKYEEIFSNPIVEYYRNLRAPSYDICGECEDLGYCNECVMRGFDRYLQRKNQGKDCQWALAFEINQFAEEAGITLPA